MRASTAISLRRAWFAACAVAVTVCAHALTSDAVHLSANAPLLWIGVFAATFAAGSRVPAQQFRLWRGRRIVTLLVGTQLGAHLVLGVAPQVVGITSVGGHHHHHESAALIDIRSAVVHLVAAAIIGVLLRSGQRRLAGLVHRIVARVREAFARRIPPTARPRTPCIGLARPVLLCVGETLPSRGPPAARPA